MMCDGPTVRHRPGTRPLTPPWSASILGVGADNCGDRRRDHVGARAHADHPVIDLLVERGADGIEHPGGTLLAHLRRVASLLEQWGADDGGAKGGPLSRLLRDRRLSGCASRSRRTSGARRPHRCGKPRHGCIGMPVATAVPSTPSSPRRDHSGSGTGSPARRHSCPNTTRRCSSSSPRPTSSTW